MPRPRCCRRIACRPGAARFLPSEGGLAGAADVVMTLDEFEAIRLADLLGLYQEQAADRMEVSRTTFGRIVDSAHRKIAEALVEGRPIRIEGGTVLSGARRRCGICAAEWDGASGCPRCGEPAAPVEDADRKGAEVAAPAVPGPRACCLGRGRRRCSSTDAGPGPTNKEKDR